MFFQTINALHGIHNPCEGVGCVRNAHTTVKTQKHTDLRKCIRKCVYVHYVIKVGQ